MDTIVAQINSYDNNPIITNVTSSNNKNIQKVLTVKTKLINPINFTRRSNQ